MMGKIGALVAAVVAGATAAGATVWAKRRKNEEGLDLEVAEATDTSEAAGGTETEAEPGGAQVPVVETAVATDAADDLTSLKGVGAVIAERLRSNGVTTFAEIAAWSDEDIAEIAPKIKASADRIKHEDWVGQARAAVEG